jgi:DNA-binding response OmpR family regulator
MMNGTKILVVSSDSALIDFTKGSLIPCGSHVVVAPSAEIAYALARVQPDIIIVDIAMPELGGIVHCLDIRQRSQAPIIMLSTYCTRDGEVRGLDLKNDYSLSEPFDGDELVNRIADALSRNRDFQDCVSDYALAVPLDNDGLSARMDEVMSTDSVCPDFFGDFYSTVLLDTSHLNTRMEELSLGQAVARN